jgi:hypothetical protein
MSRMSGTFVERTPIEEQQCFLRIVQSVRNGLERLSRSRTGSQLPQFITCGKNFS